MVCVSPVVDFLFKTFFKIQALRAGAMGPVCICACVDLHRVRVGPVVGGAGGGSETGGVATSETGGGDAATSVIVSRV